MKVNRITLFHDFNSEIVQQQNIIDSNIPVENAVVSMNIGDEIETPSESGHPNSSAVSDSRHLDDSFRPTENEPVDYELLPGVRCGSELIYSKKEQKFYRKN